MTSQISWRMLAISAAVAVMLTACGGGSGSGNANGDASGASNINANGDASGASNINAPTSNAVTPTDVRIISVDTATNTATVALVDASGNVVPVSQQVTVEVPEGSGNFLDVGLTNGVGTVPLPSGDNGTQIGVTDPSTPGTSFSATVPGARFHPNRGGHVSVELVDQNGQPFPGSSAATVSGTDNLVQDGTTVDLSSGSGRFDIDTSANSPGARTFTLTDPDSGISFTGIVDTGSATNSRGDYILGCNQYSLSSDDDAFIIKINGSEEQQALAAAPLAVANGTEYTYEFEVKYYDSANSQLTNVSRNVEIRIDGGQGTLGQGQKTSMEVPMQNGKGGPITFTPRATGEFKLAMVDTECNDAKNTDNQRYTRHFTVR